VRANLTGRFCRYSADRFPLSPRIRTLRSILDDFLRRNGFDRGVGFAKSRTDSTQRCHCPTRRRQNPQPADVVDDLIEHAPTALEIAVAEPFNLFSPHDDTASHDR
jgi:hypothetical protein